jgi:hypothetical protein
VQATTTTKTEDKKMKLKFEMTELQYEIVKAALRSAQVATRNELAKAESRDVDSTDEMAQRNKEAMTRVLTADYDKNFEVQQLMADQAWKCHDEAEEEVK